MANPNPPLFVQDGEYPAKLDRNLIGALLQPSTSSTNPLLPRPGVRAHYVDAAGETSLRVEVSGAEYKILAGSAFVGGPSEDGIGSIYLITNPNDKPLAPPPIIAGAEQQGMIGIKVTDPGDSPTGGASEGKWEIVYLSTVPADPIPTNFLRLASVTIPGNAATPLPAPVDNRLFTTALGGVMRVASRDTLNSSAANAPYGSQAYAMAENQMYVCGKDGWAPYPAVVQVNGTASNGGISGHQGELLWNSINQTLAIYQGNEWIDIARAAGVSRLGGATSWPKGPNETVLAISSLKIFVPAGSSWLSISHPSVTLWDPAMEKPPETSLLIDLNLPAPRTKISVLLYATVEAFIKNASGGFDPDLTNTFSLNVDAYTSSGTTFDDQGRPSGYQQQYALIDASGETWTTQPIKKEFHMEMNNLDRGRNSLRLVFKAANAGYFDIRDLRFQVNTT